MEPEGSLPSSQKSATGPYPEPAESSLDRDEWLVFVNTVMNIRVSWKYGISWPDEGILNVLRKALCYWVRLILLT
jgi:hypothetical protein